MLRALAHVVFLLPLSEGDLRFFSKFLRILTQLVPDARKSLEVLLELKSENMMDQVNFGAHSDT